MGTISTPPAGTITRVAAGSTGAPHVAGNGGVVVWPQAHNGHMAIMKYDHGSISQISEDGYDCTNPVLSDDGSVCVYSRFTPSHDTVPASFDIYKNENGVNTPVVETAGNEFATAVSGDGKVIAWDDDMQTQWHMFRVGKSEDGKVTYLTNGKIDAECPFIADANNQVFFVEHSAGRTRISAEQPDGTTAPVAYDESGMVFPDVTRDGKTLTWSGAVGDFSVLKTCTDGHITIARQAPKTDYLWSQINGDGTQMVWTAFDRNVPDPSHPDTSILYTDGTDTFTMQKNDGPVIPVMPDISKDGSTMAWFTVNLDNPNPETQVFVYEKSPDAPPAPPSTPTAHPTQDPSASQATLAP